MSMRMGRFGLIVSYSALGVGIGICINGCGTSSRDGMNISSKKERALDYDNPGGGGRPWIEE